MVINSTMAFVVLCTAIVVTGFLIAPNRSRFLLAAAVMTIAWQGGYRIEIVKMDFTLTYFIFVLLFFWNFVNPQRRFQLKGRFPVPIYFWIGVIVFCALAIIPAVDKHFALSGVMRTIISVIVFFAVLKSLRSASDVQFFVGTLIAAMIFQGILASLQFKIPGFKIGVVDQTQSWMWWRTKGTFYHANEMGMYSLLMLPIIARVLFQSLIKGNRKWIYFSGIAVILGGIALFTSANRGSWIGLFLAIILMLGYDFFKRGIKLKKVLIGLSIPATILLTIFAIKQGSYFIDRLFYGNASGILEGRIQYQQESLALIKAHPIIGVGFWNYVNHVNSYFVHNLYLLVASEIGIPGLVFMAGFLFTILGHIIKGMRSKIFFITNLSRGCFASFVGFMVASIPGPDFWISHSVQMYFWMIVALQVALLRLEKRILAQFKLHKQRSRMDAVPQRTIVKELSAVPTLERNFNTKNSLFDFNIDKHDNQQ